MNKACVNSRLLLDLGSRSAKAYVLDQSLTEARQVTWELIEREPAEESIRRSLKELVSPYESVTRGGVFAFGTEAMRMNRTLESSVATVCRELSIFYRTLTHQEEATLILEAVSTPDLHTIVNVGGGSVQIVCPESLTITLLEFGIADLNRSFSLLESPA